MLDGLLAAVERELPRAVELRRRLHAMPELAHHERRTADAIAAELPVDCRPIAGTGRLALVSDTSANADGRASGGGGADVGATQGAAGADPPRAAPAGASPRPVAVRAELDGLPVRERTGAAFSASGDCMHACGHDVHMAALVALVRAAHAQREQLTAPLLAVFQPSEEAYPSGARLIADEGFAGLAPTAVLAAHVHPELPWGSVALDAGPVNASFDAIEITIEGEPSHGAYPHRGRDPILALASVIVTLHAQAGRRVDPRHAATVTVGAVEGGSADNVIPRVARATGALRAQRHEDRLALRELAEQVVCGVAAAHGCRGTLALTAGEPALDNDAELVAAARGLLARVGLRAAPEWRSCGSDDFAFFAERAPIAMAFVGLAGAAGFQPRPLHHPELLVPDAAVGAIARVQAILYAAGARRAVAG
jgi:amidohydrolase